MKTLRFPGTAAFALINAAVLLLPCPGFAETVAPKPASPPATTTTTTTAKKTTTKKLPDWKAVIGDAKPLPGLFTLYYSAKEQKLLMEIRKDQLGKDLLCPIAIARGAGEAFLAGDTLNFGNQWVLSFRRARNTILVVRRNTRFVAKPGTPRADAVEISYTDSVLAAVPIRGMSDPNGTKVLIDLADLLMIDLAGFGMAPDRRRCTWFKVKAFPKNVEIEVSLVFTAKTRHWRDFEPDVPDARGTQVVVHYGLSALPSSKDYRPRLADDRIGHFLSVVKDYSSDLSRSAFKRYVTRWKLEKSDPKAAKSPARDPIIFWIEKTVPREYRPFVKAGILEWNKAFERIGFIDAIQVRDQQPGDDFDPEDIRYNTFRWISASAGFAMGPSRTNPRTGQILDADIIFDEDMIRYWRDEYLRVPGVPQGMALLEKGARQAWFKLYAAEIPWFTLGEPLLDDWMESHRPNGRPQPEESSLNGNGRAYAWMHDANTCLLGPGMKRQLGLLAAIMQAQKGALPGGKVPPEFVGQALKEIVMHEVGHTLGLRHNFKASARLSLKDINDPAITREQGMAGSVMDYLPANFAPKGQKQGDYFSTTIGPYDYWAIQYAYAPLEGDEEEELRKIASKAADPDFSYGTDNDLSYSPDPHVNVFDLGDPLEYSKQRIELVSSYMGDLAERVVAEGEGWQRARSAFSLMLGEIYQAASLASFYVGSEHIHRDHRGDPNARRAFEPVPAAKQREAIAFLKENILSGKAFNFPSEVQRRLAPSFWRHWGAKRYRRGFQYPLQQQILRAQMVALQHFLDSDVLHRIQNIQSKTAKGEDALKMEEVFDALTDSIWAEVIAAAGSDDAVEAKLSVTPTQRNFQREHFKRLALMVLGSSSREGGFFSFVYSSTGEVPADARSLARMHLKRISALLDKSLKLRRVKPDTLTQAHLEELQEKIDRVLTASLSLAKP